MADTVEAEYEPTEVAVHRLWMIANFAAKSWWQDYCPCWLELEEPSA